MGRLALGSVVIALVLAPVRPSAAFTLQDCQKGLHAAAAKYGACQDKAVLKLISGSFTDFVRYNAAAARCVAKYAAVWPRLAAKAYLLGGPCDHSSRFEAFPGVVVDHLTRLTWEKKTNLDTVANPGDPHDGDNTYNLITGSPDNADGTVYAGLLTILNDGCFAGSCNWRLPSLYELQAIVPQPCTVSPCIDPAFGPTSPGSTWVQTYPGWFIDFGTGDASYGDKIFFGAARAVRE